MQAARILAPKQGEVTRLEPPTPGPDDVLIEVRRAGICGTDIHIWHGDYALARFPLVPGHEFAGVVTAIGDNVTRYKIGDRVTADPNIPCLVCSECQRTAFNQCHNLQAVGVTRNGAFARFVSVPERSTFPIGDLSFAAGALVEPLACVVWGLKQVRITPGDQVIIFGAGPMGCLLLQAVKRAGAATVTVVDRSERRLELAKKLGAHHVLQADGLSPEQTRDIAPDGFEVVTDATGVPKVIESLPAYARPAGTLWIFGVAPESATASFKPYDIFRRDLRIIGSFAINKTFQEAIALIRGGAVELEPLVSHTIPLSDFTEGLHLAEHDPERMKVQFAIGDD